MTPVENRMKNVHSQMNHVYNFFATEDDDSAMFKTGLTVLKVLLTVEEMELTDVVRSLPCSLPVCQDHKIGLTAVVVGLTMQGVGLTGDITNL